MALKRKAFSLTRLAGLPRSLWGSFPSAVENAPHSPQLPLPCEASLFDWKWRAVEPPVCPQCRLPVARSHGQMSVCPSRPAGPLRPRSTGGGGDGSALARGLGHSEHSALRPVLSSPCPVRRVGRGAGGARGILRPVPRCRPWHGFPDPGPVRAATEALPVPLLCPWGAGCARPLALCTPSRRRCASDVSAFRHPPRGSLRRVCVLGSCPAGSFKGNREAPSSRHAADVSSVYHFSWLYIFSNILLITYFLFLSSV